MRRTIMYYPNIEIPDGNWLRKALLYWDEVSSIVPREVEFDTYSNNQIIALLKDEGEYRPIYPDRLMNSKFFGDFEKECINRVKSYLKIINKNQHDYNRPSRTRIHNEKLVNHYGVHRDKMSYKIMDLLNNEGLISPDENWVNLDNQLANIYMSTLAKYSALSDTELTVIGTDKIGAINSVYPVKYISRSPMLNKVPVINLSLNILPTPNTDVSYKKILNFKRKYRADLLAFRNIINDFEEQVSNAESEYDLKEKIVRFKEAVELGTRETMRMLKGARINFVLSSLKSVINLKSPTMIATYAGIVGHKYLGMNPAITLSGIGVASLVDVSLNYMAINKSTRDKLSDKGFLYLYYAKRKGIITDII